MTLWYSQNLCKLGNGSPPLHHQFGLHLLPMSLPWLNARSDIKHQYQPTMPQWSGRQQRNRPWASDSTLLHFAIALCSKTWRARHLLVPQSLRGSVGNIVLRSSWRCFDIKNSDNKILKLKTKHLKKYDLKQLVHTNTHRYSMSVSSNKPNPVMKLEKMMVLGRNHCPPLFGKKHGFFHLSRTCDNIRKVNNNKKITFHLHLQSGNG